MLRFMVSQRIRHYSQTELTSSQFFNRDQSLCLPIVSASLDLSVSIIYYGLEGVIMWGSITVQSVPY